MYTQTSTGRTWDIAPLEVDGILFPYGMTPEYYLEYGITYTPDPTPEPIATQTPIVQISRYSRLEFMNQFTTDEMIAIYTAAKTNVMIEIMLDKIKIAAYIDVTDPETIAAINLLESSGLIATGRAALILVNKNVS